MSIEILTKEDIAGLIEKVDFLTKEVLSLKELQSKGIGQGSAELENYYHSPSFVSEKMNIPIRRLRYWIDKELISKKKIGRTVLIDVREVKKVLSGDKLEENVVPMIHQRKTKMK